MTRAKLVSEIRNALADYIWSEGCHCCQDVDAHREAEARLATLLGVPQYGDGSGYDFHQFKTEETA